MSCRCSGYEGCTHAPNECPNPGGGHKSLLFCQACDLLRIAYLSTQLAQLDMDDKEWNRARRRTYLHRP